MTSRLSGLPFRDFLLLAWGGGGREIINRYCIWKRFPVERLGFSCDREFIGSLSHDEVLRDCDGRVFDDEEEGEGGEEEEEEGGGGG